MAEVWFIRHFRTPWNAEGRLQGRRDTALDDPLGDGDLAALASNLASIGARDFGAVWCSPLVRARQTAALHGHAVPDLDEDLAELSFGVWEGRLWSDLHAAHPGAWQRAPQDLPLGESFAGFADRVRRVLHRAAARQGAPVLIFGHGAWANCAQAISAGLPPERMHAFSTANGALIRLNAVV